MSHVQRYAVIVGYARNGEPYAGHVIDVFRATPDEVSDLQNVYAHDRTCPERYIVCCGDRAVLLGDEVDVDEQRCVRGP